MDKMHSERNYRLLDIRRMTGRHIEPMNDRRIGQVVCNLYYPDCLKWDDMGSRYYAVNMGVYRKGGDK